MNDDKKQPSGKDPGKTSPLEKALATVAALEKFGTATQRIAKALDKLLADDVLLRIAEALEELSQDQPLHQVAKTLEDALGYFSKELKEAAAQKAGGGGEVPTPLKKPEGKP